MNTATSAESNLPAIENTDPVSESDQSCLRDIEAILKKHDKLERFGVTLLHKHFPLQPSEVLVEACDPETRTLTITPINAKTINPDHYIETCWRLDTGQALMRCNIEVYHAR